MIADIRNKAAAIAMAVICAVSVSGCSDGGHKKGEKAASSSAGNYPVSSYERSVSSEMEDSTEVIALGGGSIFGGIAVESDENGEIVVTEVDGELRYRITDERFGSYKAFSNYVKKKSGKKAINQYSPYFGERDGAMCLIVGAGGRDVKGTSQYYYTETDGSYRMTVEVTHTDECLSKHGFSRSQVTFVKADGVWKLENITLFIEK